MVCRDTHLMSRRQAIAHSLTLTHAPTHKRTHTIYNPINATKSRLAVWLPVQRTIISFQLFSSIVARLLWTDTRYNVFVVFQFVVSEFFHNCNQKFSSGPLIFKIFLVCIKNPIPFFL
jgi:hypothetical protein